MSPQGFNEYEQAASSKKNSNAIPSSMKNPSHLDIIAGSPDAISESMGYLGNNPQSCGGDDFGDYNRLPDLNGMGGPQGERKR